MKQTLKTNNPEGVTESFERNSLCTSALFLRRGLLFNPDPGGIPWYPQLMPVKTPATEAGASRLASASSSFSGRLGAPVDLGRSQASSIKAQSSECRTVLSADWPSAEPAPSMGPKSSKSVGSGLGPFPSPLAVLAGCEVTGASLQLHPTPPASQGSLPCVTCSGVATEAQPHSRSDATPSPPPLSLPTLPQVTPLDIRLQEPQEPIVPVTREAGPGAGGGRKSSKWSLMSAARGLGPWPKPLGILTGWGNKADFDPPPLLWGALPHRTVSINPRKFHIIRCPPNGSPQFGGPEPNS